MIKGENARTATAGKKSKFKIIARDQEGNRRCKGGDEFQVTVIGPDSVHLGGIVDHDDGQYTVSYRATRKGWYLTSMENCP